MKKIFLLLCVAAGIASCGTDDKQAAPGPAEPTTIEWIDSTSKNLGQVKEGTIVEVSYRFRNSGKNQLIIENVTASCGCTVPEKPQQPIPPGGEETIRAKFDSRGKPGNNSKSITVTANIPNKQADLQFSVEVVK